MKRAWAKPIAPKIEAQPRRKRGGLRFNRLLFNHGLGDALMLRAILPFIPQKITLHIPSACGYLEAFPNAVPLRGVVSNLDLIRFWAEDSHFVTVSGKKTKPRICLEHEFGILNSRQPIRPLPLKLGKINNAATRQTDSLLNQIGGDYVACHFQAASSPERKSAHLWQAYGITESLLDAGKRVDIINPAFRNRYE